MVERLFYLTYIAIIVFLAFVYVDARAWGL